MKLIAIIICLFALMATKTYAAEQATCFKGLEAMQNSLSYVGEKNISFSLKKDAQTEYMVFISKAPPAGDEQHWQIMKFNAELGKYCLFAQGKTVEVLANVASSNFADRYGLPGSGYPRCSNGKSLLPGSATVRFWANRELGDSSVMSLTGSDGPKDYTILVSTDRYWILLDIDHQNLQSCYVDRGNSANGYADLKMPATSHSSG